MKETRFFYVPDAAVSDTLPDEEAAHALRVIRMKKGDEMMLMDGCGCYYRATVTETTNHVCRYAIEETLPQQRQWSGRIYLAIAPTKMIDRMEWLVEKAVEVGVDEITFLNCQFSERKVVKTARMEKIAVAAMKQSHKAWKTTVNELTTFDDFISQPRQGRKFIAHCYNEYERKNLFAFLRTVLPDEEITVLIGPEGDFSTDEVERAIAAGYESVDLGNSRLRTETAGLMAVVMFQLR